MAIKYIPYEEAIKKPGEYIPYEDTLKKEDETGVTQELEYAPYKPPVEIKEQTYVPFDSAMKAEAYVPFETASGMTDGLPAEEEVQKYFTEKYKPLQEIPKSQGYLTKEQIVAWDEINRNKPDATEFEYKPVDVSTKEYNNIISKTMFDVLQRGEFAVANAVDAVLRGDDNIIGAAIDGLTGREKRDFYDIAIGIGYGKWGALAIGMTAGITLDPINYVPFGKTFQTLKKAYGKTKAAEVMGNLNIAKFLRKGFTSGEGAPKALHELVKNLKKHKRYDEGLLYEEIDKMSKLVKNKKNAELITKVKEGRMAIEDLSPDALSALKKIDKGYKNIGDKAVEFGFLKKEDLLDNYQHHFYENLTKINSNIKNGHAGAPAFAYPRHIENIIDYGNARTDLISKVTDAVKANNIEEARKLIEKFPMGKGTMLVNDASTYTLKQTLMKAKSVPKPNLNALENYGYRKLEHIGAVYRQKVINTVVDPSLPYAKPISKMTSKTLTPGNKIYAVKYRIPEINLKEADDAGIALYNQLVKHADEDIIEISPKLADELLDSPYMQKLYGKKGPRLFEMPKEIVNYLDETSQLFKGKYETLDKVLTSATKIQNMWKPYATVYRPFWHIRNVTFNQMQLYLSGVSPVDLVPRAVEAFKATRGKKGILATKNYGKPNLKHVGTELRKAGLFGVGFAGGDIASETVAIKKIKRAAEPARVTLGDITKAPKQVFMKPAEFFEDNAHMVAALDYIAKADDPDLATAIINGAKHAFKYTFDYGDLSRFEKGVAKLVDPFYAWHRKAIGLYAGELLEQPEKFSKLGKFKKTLGRINPETEQEKALKPEWMDEQGYMKSPFKVGGKETYFYLPMPPDDLELLLSAKNMVGVLTPYYHLAEIVKGIKNFPELGTKFEGYAPAPAYMTHFPEKTWKLLKLKPGRQTDYSTGKTVNVLQIPKKILYAIETAMPTLRDVHNMWPQNIELARDKALTKTWSQGTGLGLVNENINQWRNTINFDIQATQEKLIKNAKKFEGVEWRGSVYNYVNETVEGQELQREIKRLADKLRY